MRGWPGWTQCAGRSTRSAARAAPAREQFWALRLAAMPSSGFAWLARQSGGRRRHSVSGLDARRLAGSRVAPPARPGPAPAARMGGHIHKIGVYRLATRGAGRNRGHGHRARRVHITRRRRLATARDLPHRGGCSAPSSRREQPPARMVGLAPAQRHPAVDRRPCSRRNAPARSADPADQRGRPDGLARRSRPDTIPSGRECAPSGRSGTARSPRARRRPRSVPMRRLRSNSRCDTAPSRPPRWPDTRPRHTPARFPRNRIRPGPRSRPSAATPAH